jgi:lipoprotein-anchoring transpeptidase ErfK/SrfK
MGLLLRVGLLIGLISALASPAVAKRHGKSHHAATPSSHKPSEAEIEAATRLQVFLDRANFSPGKIDGHYNDFTLKAMALYRQSRGEATASPQDYGTTTQQDQGTEEAKSEGRKSDARDPRPEVTEKKGAKQKQSSAPPKPDTAPDLSGIDLASVNPVFIQYTVTDADTQNIAPVPRGESAAVAAAKAKLPALPYRDVGQEIAEKFHCDEKFLGELNPGKNGATLKPGDQLRVPNVEPFELEAVKNLKPGSELRADAANEMPDEAETAPSETSPSPAGDATSSVRIKVDVKTNMLGVFEGDKIVAAYPVTVGSGEMPTPIGEWKVRGVAKFPTFRYDEKMLKSGERGKDFYILKPGPNNPVGVIWIALNKRGIGIHGTDEPDMIGKVASHGCIRLANWDIVRLAERVKAGVPVEVK